MHVLSNQGAVSMGEEEEEGVGFGVFGFALHGVLLTRTISQAFHY